METKKKPQQVLRLFPDRVSCAETQTESGPSYLAWLRLNMRSIFSLVASQQDWDWLAAFSAWLAVLWAALEALAALEPYLSRV